MSLASIELQRDRLRAVSPDLPIIQMEGEPEMVALLLPDGWQIVAPVSENGSYDLWFSSSSVGKLDLTLDEARALVRVS